jgi:hypothetical protein
LSAVREAKEALRIAAENAAVAKAAADHKAAYDAAMVVQKEAEAQREIDRLAYLEQQAADIKAENEARIAEENAANGELG